MRTFYFGQAIDRSCTYKKNLPSIRQAVRYANECGEGYNRIQTFLEDVENGTTEPLTLTKISGKWIYGNL